MIYPILALISIGNLEILNCVSPLRGGFSVKIERFQIKSNVPNLKSTLIDLFILIDLATIHNTHVGHTNGSVGYVTQKVHLIYSFFQ